MPEIPKNAQNDGFCNFGGPFKSILRFLTKMIILVIPGKWPKWPFLAILVYLYIGLHRAYFVKSVQNPLGAGPKMSKMAIFAIFESL
jgi:hypothetical protein